VTVTLTSTTRIVDLERDGVRILGRIWEGTTASGIRVVAVIPRIAAATGDNLEEFERDLQQCEPPSAMAVEAIPLRLVL
jgi:hypothetical protein